MTNYAATTPIAPIKTIRSQASWSPKPLSSRQTEQICVIVNSMSSKYPTTPSPETGSHHPDLAVRWRRILALAGAWGEPEDLPANWLDEIRNTAWASRLDTLDDTPQSPPHNS